MGDRSPQLEIVVDSRLDEPVYAQIASQLREAIASSVLSPSATLPSVRALASDLGVNLNTVARAYRLLEDQGFVAIESRSGVRVVAPGARGSGDMRSRLAEELRTLLWRMRQAGFTPDELHGLARSQIALLERPPVP